MRKTRAIQFGRLFIGSAGLAALAAISGSSNANAQNINALHQFGGGHGVVVNGTLDGYLASGGLAASGNVLYGTTAVGGFGVTDGTAWSFIVPETNTLVLLFFSVVAASLLRRWPRLKIARSIAARPISMEVDRA